MEVIIVATITAIASILASGGLWSFIQHRHNKNNASTRLIRGIGYTLFIRQCMMYVDRGKISHSEYVELTRMLYEPYKALGGNGAADRAFELVRALPDARRSVIDEMEKEMFDE